MELSKSLADRHMDSITVGRTSIIKAQVNTLLRQDHETQSDSIARYDFSVVNLAKRVIDGPGTTESDQPPFFADVPSSLKLGGCGRLAEVICR